MSIKKVLGHVDKNMNVLVKDLRVLIQQPSVSAKNQGIKKCANLVKNTLKKSGIKAEKSVAELYMSKSLFAFKSSIVFRNYRYICSLVYIEYSMR